MTRIRKVLEKLTEYKGIKDIKQQIKNSSDKYASIKVLSKRQGQDYYYHTDFIPKEKIEDAIKILTKYFKDSVGYIKEMELSFSDKESKAIIDGYSKNILELK